MKNLIANLIDAVIETDKEHYKNVLHENCLYDENEQPDKFIANTLSGDNTHKLVKAIRKSKMNFEGIYRQLKELEHNQNYIAIYYYIALLVVAADGYLPPYYNALHAEPEIMKEYLHQVILDIEDCI